jgi:tight adherence protein C
MTGLFTLTDLPVLLAATALFVAGAALIASARRTRNEALLRRVALIEPRFAGATPGAVPRADGEALFRTPAQGGVAEPVHRQIVRLLAHIYVEPRRALAVFMLLRLVVAATFGVGIYLWAGHIERFAAAPLIPLLLAAMVAILGWFVPMFVISYAVRQRTKAVRAGLPDALELLVVCVEAGLSLEDGLARVVAELRHAQPALADELNITLADLAILPNREQALSNLAERVDVPSVRSVVTTLAQTLRYGTPLVQALRVTAAELRNDYLIELEERANRLPAYMTIPVIIFLMPTIFLVVGGPAALRLIDAFMHR